MFLCRFKGTNGLPAKTQVEILIESGALDKKLKYQPGHAIHDQYIEHKAAGRIAGEASASYKNKREELHADAETPEGHRQLAPLAMAASKAAKMYVSRASRVL